MVLHSLNPPVTNMSRKPISSYHSIFSRPYRLTIPSPTLPVPSPFCTSCSDVFVFDVDTNVLPQPGRPPYAAIPIMHLQPNLPGPLTEAETVYIGTQIRNIRHAFYDAVTTVLCHLYGRPRAVKTASLTGWHVRFLDQVIRALGLGGSKMDGFTAAEEWRDALLKAQGSRGDVALPHLYRSYYDAGDFEGWVTVVKKMLLKAERIIGPKTSGGSDLVVSGSSLYFLIPGDILPELDDWHTTILTSLREEVAYELSILRQIPAMTTSELLRFSTQCLEPKIETAESIALVKRNTAQINLIHLSRAWAHHGMSSPHFASSYSGTIANLVEHMLEFRILNDPFTQLDCALWSLHWATEGKTRDVKSQAVSLADEDLEAFWQETKSRREDCYMKQETERLMDMLVAQQSRVNIA